MNKPIVRVYVVILLLFAGLVGFTSYWSVFDADDAQGNEPEPPAADRGRRRSSAATITTADGQVVAETPAGGRRRAPDLRAPLPAGRCSATRSATATSLAGQTRHRAVRERRAGRQPERVLVDHRPAPRARPRRATTSPSRSTRGVQRPRLDALSSADRAHAGGHGAGGPSSRSTRTTGAIKAMVVAARPTTRTRSTSPKTYEQAEQPAQHGRASSSTAPRSRSYPPGSTMKVVTAAAGARHAATSRRPHAQRAAPDRRSAARRSRTPAGEQFGDIDMTTALTHSVNTYFAQVGEKLGPRRWSST